MAGVLGIREGHEPPGFFELLWVDRNNKGPRAAADMMYHRTLRTIGQALEARSFSKFVLRHTGNHYQVSGKPDRRGFFQLFLQILRSGKGASYQLIFTLHDIQRLEREGRAKRLVPNKLPDFHRLPNTLRTIGAYLDRKKARLLEIQKGDLTVVILYQANEGHPELEERAIGSFYDFFIELYEKRAQSNAH